MNLLHVPLIAHLMAHPHWAEAFIFFIAFFEAFAVIGTFVPAAAPLFLAGTLAGAGSLSLWALFGWAIAGAIAGDGVSYWLGHHYQDRIENKWPFSHHPALLERGGQFFRQHGGKSIILGRFIAPVRALVPVIAGMLGMRPSRFYTMNILSALVWAPVHILPGVLFGASLRLAGAVTSRLVIILILLVAVLWLVVWLVGFTIRWLLPLVEDGRTWLIDWAEHHPGRRSRAIVYLLHPERPSSAALLALTLLLVVGAWGFLVTLLQVLTAGRLIDMDNSVYHFMQGLRTPWMDEVMLALSVLGGPAVMGIVILAVIAWLAWQRNYKSILYCFVAFGGAQLCAFFLKLTVHRPRPTGLSGSWHTFSYPSMPTTLAAAVYGFLAFLAARNMRPGGGRLAIAIVSALALTLICFCRIYLGAEWLTDIIGGMGLGLAWTALLAIIYTYHPPARLPAGQLLGLTVVVLLISGIWRVGHLPPSSLDRYLPATQLSYLSEQQWLASAWRHQVSGRYDLAGTVEEPFNLQWVGMPDDIRAQLMVAGWRRPIAATWRNALVFLDPHAPITDLPVLPLLSSGRPPVVVLTHPDGRSLTTRLVIRLYPTHFIVRTTHLAVQEPLWIGMVTREQQTHPLALVTLATTQSTIRDPASLLSAPPFRQRVIVRRVHLRRHRERPVFLLPDDHTVFPAIHQPLPPIRR